MISDSAILQRIRDQQKADFETARKSCLVLEQRREPPSSKKHKEASCRVMPYEWIHHSATTNERLAVRSTTEPVLDAPSVAAIRTAAQEVWDALRRTIVVVAFHVPVSRQLGGSRLGLCTNIRGGSAGHSRSQRGTARQDLSPDS